MVLGVSEGVFALVAFLVIVVLLATKIARIGEAIGGLFDHGTTASPPPSASQPPDDPPATGAA
jgi:hypothetical protein